MVGKLDSRIVGESAGFTEEYGEWFKFSVMQIVILRESMLE